MEQGGLEAVEGFLRNQLGDQAGAAIRKMDELLGLNPDSLLEAALVPSRNDFTAAGRALQKHANRQGDIWAKYLPEGALNPANYNTKAAEYIMDILSDPGTTRRYYTNKFGQSFVDYVGPDGRVIRWLTDGTFFGFMNP